ncbi:YqzL family protein [Paenibacillus tarimensis]|uniref:YqzL family protein n=1 Tax=Paenibacillus tarimensis TaxID=416012 RepID=UPI001F43537F|nr:YqzL family protein [Paenibacillus tarimensis]MCF2942069.1 YqzL family protein [Paenibacillus tarimensis]
MRDFSWTYFTLTGDVDAFLLYKQVDQVRALNDTGGPKEAMDSLEEWEEAE